MLEPDLAPFSFLPKPTTNTSTESGAAWRAVLLKSLSLVSVYGAPAECRPSTFMPSTVGIQRPWGTYSLGPGKPLEKDGLHNNSAEYREHQNTPGTAGPPVGSLTPPVSGSSRGPDGKGMQPPHQRPAVHCGYCEWRLGEEVGRGGGDGDGGPGSWSESGSESRLCLLLAVGPSAGHFSAFEPHLLSLQNEHISNTHCADLPSGAEMRCVSASLGAGTKCSVLGGYSHLLTQRTGSEEGSQSQAGSQGKRILGEPPDHTQARKRRWIPQRRPEDISGHPGSRPGAGQSGQDPVASPPLPCGGGRMPPTRFRASL